MKKNKTMRAASALLVAVLLTTSVVSGTFAKYTTTDNGEDSARVAQWGVVINVADDMNVFHTSYDVGASEVTVNNATDQQNLVAPGTKGDMSFSIAGTPEVAVKLTVECTDTNAIQLAAGTYELKANKFANTDVSVTTTGVYEPIKFYFGETKVDENTKYTLTLADLKKELNKLSEDKLAPNTPLDKTYYIGWNWAFENDVTGVAPEFTDTTEPYDGAKVVNFLDTYLGDQASSQTEAFKLKITVEQID